MGHYVKEIGCPKSSIMLISAYIICTLTNKKELGRVRLF